ncbi:MAG: DNA-directed RNA polymerase subunit beta', partial [Candidatus Kerfeldbacteria bacterium]|nr:DNA-directed RNA polymerase subunit beta' [Candidatus Kerfeldbacteria bacterium]
LGIQAFQPSLIEGKAIQVHPLVCPAFNADFDGDQMAVHVPLTEEAKWEARNLMLSASNLLKPATGEPVATPAQDIVLGCYYMTSQAPLPEGQKPKAFTNVAEAVMAYQLKHITLQETIMVRREQERLVTCVGRLLFNEVLPPELQFYNKTVDKKTLKNLVAESLLRFGIAPTAQLLDRLKEIGFSYLTLSGLSWGMDDLPDLPEREAVYAQAETRVDEVYDQYQQGLLTDEERHTKVIEIWAQVKERITDLSRKALTPRGSVFSMIESGSRGSWGQITQMMGMKGLVTNPAGETIELPVKGNFKEGFDVLEYFISTHGTRKGLTDTALRTANAGYLTRRLVDVSHDIVVVEKDCGDKEGFVITAAESEERGDTLGQRCLGRFLLHDLKDPSGGEVVVKKNEFVTLDQAKMIDKLALPELRIRSLLSCKTRRGVCQRCYGIDLGFNTLVETGTAVGIVAAQSIGEPGTQLTMRTFHTGGVASAEDITQGLPRVEEVFEARPVKRPGLLSPSDGRVQIISHGRQRTIKLTANEEVEERWPLAKYPGAKVLVKKGAKIKANEPILRVGATTVNTVHGGLVKQIEDEVVLAGRGEVTHDLSVPVGLSLWVKEDELVTRGQPLTDGSLDLHELYQLRGKEAVQRYVLKEIQYIYSSQGQKLNDKHIEVIVRQMFSRLYITDPGETELLPGEIVTVAQFEEAAEAGSGRPAQSEQLLLGITKASLSTDSFLSAASFQETARVLIDAAVTGKMDRLRGLKENVIIGRLIPAGTGRGPQADRLAEAMAELETRRQADLAAAQVAMARELELQAQAVAQAAAEVPPPASPQGEIAS